MTLAAFARLLDTTPKWVINTMRALGQSPRYTVDRARQLFVTRAVHDALSVPLARANEIARATLRAYANDGASASVTVTSSPDVSLTIDMYRLMSSFNVRMAELNESFGPPVRGRPKSKFVDPLAVAEDWGLDLSLLRDNLRKSPEERVRQLDAMRAFAKGVRRAGEREDLSRV